MQVTSSVREPLITGGKTLKDVTHDISRQVEGKPSMGWLLGLLVAVGALGLGFIALWLTLWEGIGMWGLNKTVGWAWDITNFVWWVGIGHAGTLISAVLLLFRQKWRMAINRAAEAMTIFAVICAAMFPIIHMGRPWLGAYWALPLPNTFGSLWVNFNSPLLWDVFAISTYFSVSLVFWYIGLIPDFATIRDRATGIRKSVYGALAFGWDGAAKTWSRYESVALILAGLATPLVLSVHTIVSFDFATSVIPGWHTTIFPPYFVAGAIFPDLPWY
jgi:Ni/Fe-hydrogenase subunit HybB-like protein